LVALGVKPEKAMFQTNNVLIIDEVIATPDLVEVEEDIDDEEEEQSEQDMEQEDQNQEAQEEESESENQEADDEEEQEQSGEEDNREEQQPMPQPVESLAQTQKGGSGHLHETDMRVDPPLLDEGKRSIAAAEKELEERKAEYDKFKAIAMEKELAFHAAARVSTAARENRAKAEDRYYIGSKAARKAARYAENMEREARWAAARQAAHDKFNEVMAAANKEATAKQNAAQAARLAAMQSSPPAANATQSLAVPVSNVTQSLSVPAANATASV